MTREQAEKEIRDTFTEVWADGIIKALEQEPTTKNDLGVDCKTEDYINKRELIQKGMMGCDANGKMLFFIDAKELDSLPSVYFNINKDNYESQEPILDKIREEIKVMTSNRGFLSCSVDYIHEKIDNVFDKYKA